MPPSPPRRSRIAAPTLLLLLLAACGSPGEETPAPAPGTAAPAPSAPVILVTIDTLRADRLGAYGSQRVRTPNFDRLAGESTLFANAATTVPFTLPAHSAIMTGTYPPYHGVRENVGYMLSEENLTLAEILGEAGWATAGFVSAFPLDSRWGIAQGFEHYFDDFTLEEGARANMGAVQRPGAETIAAALAWLDERETAESGEPFFLWLHLFEPHDPYEPPEPFASSYADRPYDGEVAYVDSLLGEFRRALAERGLFDDSVVVVTGDHGEGLGDHGEPFHGYFIYDSTVHVPLLIRAPGSTAGRVDLAVSHVDLAPTILQLVGVPAPGHLQGNSLVPWLLDPTTADPGREVYSESYYPLLHYGWSELRSLRSTNLKFIDAPRPELYDLSGDPGEQRNLAGELAATGFEMEQRLDALAEAIEFEGEREVVEADLDETTLRQLRALGYIAGRGATDEDYEGERADPKDKIQLHQLIMAAQSDIGQGDELAAEAKLRAVLAADAEILDANQMVGNILAERGDHGDAVPYFQAALAIDPEHEPSLYGLATAYRALGRRDEALVGFRRVLDLAPTDSKTVVATADLLVEGEDLPGATAVVRRATEAEHVPPILFNKLGELLALQGRPGEAESMFQRASEAGEELAQPHFNLAVLYEERGDLARAVAEYETAIERSGTHYQSLFNLGRIEGLRGNLERQRELYERAIEANPEFVRGYLFLAKLLMDTGGDLSRAEELVREGITLDTEQITGPLGYFLLADILNRQGRTSEAQEAVRRGRAMQEGGS